MNGRVRAEESRNGAVGRRPTRRRSCTLLLVALTTVAVILPSQAARAGSYVVLSCNSAWQIGYSAEAWAPWANVGHAYADCPSATDNRYSGISTSVIGFTAPFGAASKQLFYAPPGTTIAGFSWNGRYNRESCGWGAAMYTHPGPNFIFGLRPGYVCGDTNLDLRSTHWISLAVPPGATVLEQVVSCGWASCGPGATFHSTAVAVAIDDPVAPSFTLDGPLVTRRWVSGRQDVAINAYDNVGIAGYAAGVGRETQSASFSCSYTRARPCDDHSISVSFPTADLPEGRNTLAGWVSDAGGNSTPFSHSIQVDNRPPERVRPSVVGGESWRTENSFQLRWDTPEQPYAPIVRAHYRLCHAGRCSDRHVAGDSERFPPIVVAEGGEHTVQVWLEDEAGNQSYDLSASELVHLRLDQEAPRIAFEAADPADPLRVAVRVEDRQSGLESGEVEIRRRGGEGWLALPTTRDDDRLVGYVDDERVRSGTYELRARVRDRAGNEASTDRRADGSAAAIDLPVRFATRMRVGLRRVSRARRGGARPRLLSQARVRNGRRVRLRGWLRSLDGTPIAGATIEVSADSAGDAVGLLPVGVTKTGRTGRFTYVAHANRSKVLRFRYGGSSQIRSTTRDFVLRVPASATIRARPRRLLNGEAVNLSGRVTTGPLPAAGKLIEVQAFFRDRWRTFSTARSGPDGRWRFRYRFGGTRGRVTYRLRARLPAESGYPFDTGHSRVVRVIVAGL